MYDPSFSGSFDPVTRLVARVPIKFIVGALAVSEFSGIQVRLQLNNGPNSPQDAVEPMMGNCDEAVRLGEGVTS
jgi:hypothetical protein